MTETFETTTVVPEMGVLQAGAIVFVGIGAQSFFSYLFHLVSARSLGPASYSDVATLTAILGVVTLPLGGAQLFVARHVAGVGARGGSVDEYRYVSSLCAVALVGGGLVTLVLLACAPLIRTELSIESLSAVILAILATTPSFMAPVLVGAAQGRHRFKLVALAIAAPAGARVVFAAAELHAGLGVAGTMAATLAAAGLAVAIPFAVLRPSLHVVTSWRPRVPRREALALAPVIAGALAIVCLSTDDVVAAKVAFPAHQAGIYGGASLVGRVILYLPAALVTVLLPKVAARASVARGTGALFLWSLLATAAFCFTATTIYATASRPIMTLAFGSSYRPGAPLLWMFGVAMTIYALLNILLAYRIGHGETQTCWFLLAGALIQALVYLGFHSSPRELLWASVTSGGILLLVAVIGPSSRSPSSLRSLGRAQRFAGP